MNELKVFENAEFGSVRTTEIDNEIWFVGKDVAEILGYTNPQKAIRDHIDEEDKTVNDSFTVNGTKAILINESGVYSLCFASKLPAAKKFKRWVTHDVIPSIRKTGSYGVFAEMLPKNFPEALRALAKSEEEKEVLKIERDKAIRAKGQISSSREAKALNMLSQQSKKIKKLEDQIGIGETYKTLKAIPWIGDVFVPSKGMFSQVGKALTKTSNKMGLPVKKIDTPEYPGGVNAYHIDVVSKFYDELQKNSALLSKYRVY